MKLLIFRLSTKSITRIERKRAGEKAPKERTALAVGLWSARLVNVGQLTRWRHSDLCRALLPRQGERRGACAPRNTRDRDGAKGGGVRSRAQCEPLLSGTSARRRVQVVSCSFSTFLHDAREVFPRLVIFGFTANPRRYPIKLRCLEPRLEGLKSSVVALIHLDEDRIEKDQNFARGGWYRDSWKKWWI